MANEQTEKARIASERQLKQDLKEEELAMQQAFVSAPSGIEVDNAAYLETLQAFPGVTQVEGRAVYPLSWKLPGDAAFEDGFILAAWEPFDQITLQPMRVMGQGRFPSTGQHEIAIERRMADKHGLSVGDQLVLGEVPSHLREALGGLVVLPGVEVQPGEQVRRRGQQLLRRLGRGRHLGPGGPGLGGLLAFVGQLPVLELGVQYPRGVGRAAHDDSERLGGLGRLPAAQLRQAQLEPHFFAVLFVRDSVSP